jgi:TusA-related sulfurtransferase
LLNEDQNNPPDYLLDITEEVCPLTFVKTRLQIEKMKRGQLLEIRLKGAEPLNNVPNSLAELGHQILSVEAENNATEALEDLAYRVFVQKN